MKKFLTPLLLLAAVAGAASAFAASLAPGSTPPKLDVKSWYKGAPVTSFDADKTYVVEFWATWCGPCKESIPHLTQLAKANPDVTFVGVSIWEDDNGKNISDFVKQEGDKMDYHVGYSGNQTGMAESWMKAAGQNGIPTAFLIKNNQVQWIGHPMELEQPLADIKSGKFDLKAFQAKFAKEQEAQSAQMKLQQDLAEADTLFDSGKTAEANAKLDALVKDHSQLAGTAKSIRFGWLMQSDPAAWEKQAKAMATGTDQSQKQQLAQLLMKDSQKKTGSHPDEDNKVAGWIVSTAGDKDFIPLYYAELVYENTKDYKGALEATQKCLKLLPSTKFKKNTELLKALQDKSTNLQAKVNS